MFLTTDLADIQQLPAETSGIRPASVKGDWRKSNASVMDIVKRRPAVAANNHWWPAAAASELKLVTSGHITPV
jgi:hypothetical protein